MNLATKFRYVHEFKHRGRVYRYMRRKHFKVRLKSDPVTEPAAFQREYDHAMTHFRPPSPAPAIALVEVVAKLYSGVKGMPSFTDLNPDRSYLFGWVYFIEAEGLNLVKIGWSYDPHNRLHDLLDGSPVPLRIITARPGSRSDEAKAHRLFKEYRTERGEWFRYEGLLGAHISGCLFEHGPEPWFGEAGFNLRVKAIDRRLGSKD